MVDDGTNFGVCLKHGERPGIAACRRCGRFMCPDCVSRGGEVSGELVCAECHVILASARGLRREVLWERRGGVSFARAFLTTWRDALFTPRSFFGGLDPEGELFKPLIFAAICLAVGLVGGLMGMTSAAKTIAGPSASVVVALAAAIAPGAYIATFAATVLFLHVLARGFGGRGGLRATTRAAAYCQAAAVAEVIPAFGGIIAFVLRLSLYGWGVSAVQGLSPKRALAFYVSILVVAVGFIYFAMRLAAPFVPGVL